MCEERTCDDWGKATMVNLIERLEIPIPREHVTDPLASEPRPHRLAVADSRRLIAEALSLAIGGEPAFEVVATMWGEIAPREIADSEPDLVLVGVGADEERPLALIDALARRLPAAEIVIVADAPSRRLLGAVLERSLGGLLLTDHLAASLVSSLTHIARGQAVLPSGWHAALSRPSSEPLDSLSDRQLEVLRLLAEGCSYEEIGGRLFISVNTVKFHTRSIFERLGVHNRMAAARVLGAGR
jgi:two-component system nitrate/nitrite response regulator NarP